MLPTVAYVSQLRTKAPELLGGMHVVEVSYIKRSMWAVRTGAKSNMNEYEKL